MRAVCVRDRYIHKSKLEPRFLFLFTFNLHLLLSLSPSPRSSRRSRLLFFLFTSISTHVVMPSSRRTVSDSYSNQRSSPYPSSLSLSASTALNNSTRLRRAASGSETSSRRVLADIEWWRVTQGQQFHPESTDEMAPEEENNFHEMDVPLAGATVTIQEDLNFTRTITQAAEERRTTTLEAAFVLQDVFSTSDVSHEVGCFCLNSKHKLIFCSLLTPCVHLLQRWFALDCSISLSQHS